MDRATPDTDDRSLERLARRRVGIKTGFYTHALVYVLVNLGLLAVNTYSGGPRWFVFPLLGWGLGLAIHGIATFVSLHGDGWRSRMIENEMAKLRQRR